MERPLHFSYPGTRGPISSSYPVASQDIIPRSRCQGGLARTGGSDKLAPSSKRRIGGPPIRVVGIALGVNAWEVPRNV